MAANSNSYGKITARAAKRIANSVRWTENQNSAFHKEYGDKQGKFVGGWQEFWAKLTDSDSSTPPRYAWVEQRRTHTGFEDLPGGRSYTFGTSVDRSAISSDPSAAALPTPSYVRMIISFSRDPGTGGAMMPRYTIISGGGGSDTDIGDLQTQVKIMTTNNSVGFGFVRLHPPVPGSSGED